MSKEAIVKNHEQYEIEIKHRMTSDYKYRAMVKVSHGDSSVCEFSCLTIQPVRWDVYCDGWDQLRSLGFKR
jgi:hypothetical protein